MNKVTLALVFFCLALSACQAVSSVEASPRVAETYYAEDQAFVWYDLFNQNPLEVIF